MNTVYRVVWSTELGQWVVASEFAKGRKKKTASGTKAIVALSGVAMLTAGGSAFAASGSSGYLDTCGTVGKEGSNPTSFGTSYQSTGLQNIEDCDGRTSYFDLSAGGPTGGAQVVGRGKDLSLYGGTITMNADLTMAGHRIVGLAPGVDGTDAVNLNQLNAVQNDSLKWDSGKSAFSAAHGDAPSNKITNVADGTLASGSKDAATAGQLFTTNQNVTNLTNNITEGKIGLVQQSKAGANVTVGKDTDGTAVDFKGTGGARKLINVADGTLASESKDAVNGGQLFTTNQNHTDLTNKIVQGKIGLVQQEKAGANITVGKDTDGTAVDFTGTGGARKLINVADGAVAASSKEAVNGGQLFNVAGDTSSTYISKNGAGVKYARTNDTGLTIDDAHASAAGATAVGYNAKASTADALALGRDSQATGITTVAAGGNATASGLQGSAVGYKAQATSTNTSAFGYDAQATGSSSTALGASSRASATQSIAIGQAAQATKERAAAIGRNSQASNTDSTAIGDSAKASGLSSSAFGSSALAQADYSIAIGNSAQATAKNSVALGTASTTTADLELAAYKPNSSSTLAGVTAKGEVSVGSAEQERRITNLAAGSADTDAVNVSQLKSLESKVASSGSGTDANAVHYDASPADKSKVTLAGTSSTDGGKTGGTTLSNVHQGAVTATSTDAINGSQMYAITGNPSAQQPTIPDPSNPNGPPIANPDYKGKGTRYFKANGKADDTDDASATGTNAVAMGANAKATTANSVALGAGASTNETTVNLETAGWLPSGSTSTLQAAKAIGEVSVGSAGKERRITNLAAGRVGTDAVNLSQLQAVDAKIASGSGTDGNAVHYDASPADKSKVTLAGTSSTDGGKTGGTIRYFKANGKADDTDDASATGTNAVAMGANAKATAENSVALGAGATTKADLTKAAYVPKDASPSTVVGAKAVGEVSVGSAGKERRITNLAAGADETDAVNVSQLKAVDSKFKVSGLTDDKGSVLEAVVYKPGSNKSEVIFGGANGTLLTNVAPGRIEKDSKDAVNGGQMASLRDSLQNQITNIDGRVTKIENNGGGKAPYIAAVGSTNPTNADAGTSPGVAVGYNTKATGDQASAFGDSAVASGSNSVALGNGSVADRANSVSVGSKDHERAITHVADGTAPTDAANIRMMQAGDAATLKSANDYTDSQIDDVWQNLSGEIDHVNRQANRGIAAASALINVTPYLPGHTAVNAGVATYRGEVALGIGVSRWSENGRVNFNAGVSAAKGDDAVIRVGVGYVF